MFKINVVTKTKGWWWKKEKYNLYRVVRVTQACDLGSFYYHEEYETIAEYSDLEEADKHLQKLVKFNVN